MGSNDIQSENIINSFEKDDCKSKKDIESLFQKDQAYHELFKKVVDESFSLINKNSQPKHTLRKVYSIIIFGILFLQLCVLFVFIGVGIISNEGAVIGSLCGVSIEALGVVGIMVKYAFNDQTEIEITKAIQNVVTGYKKYNQKD